HHRYHTLLSKHPATTEIYTLSLHDALPISGIGLQRHGGEPRDLRQLLLQLAEQGAVALRLLARGEGVEPVELAPGEGRHLGRRVDRKSTRLNSSHVAISYAVFCLKKKKRKQ